MSNNKRNTDESEEALNRLRRIADTSYRLTRAYRERTSTSSNNNNVNITQQQQNQQQQPQEEEEEKEEEQQLPHSPIENSQQQQQQQQQQSGISGLSRLSSDSEADSTSISESGIILPSIPPTKQQQEEKEEDGDDFPTTSKSNQQNQQVQIVSLQTQLKDKEELIQQQQVKLEELNGLEERNRSETLQEFNRLKSIIKAKDDTIKQLQLKIQEINEMNEQLRKQAEQEQSHLESLLQEKESKIKQQEKKINEVLSAYEQEVTSSKKTEKALNLVQSQLSLQQRNWNNGENVRKSVELASTLCGRFAIELTSMSEQLEQASKAILSIPNANTTVGISPVIGNTNSRRRASTSIVTDSEPREMASEVDQNLSRYQKMINEIQSKAEELNQSFKSLVPQEEIQPTFFIREPTEEFPRQKPMQSQQQQLFTRRPVSPSEFIEQYQPTQMQEQEQEQVQQQYEGNSRNQLRVLHNGIKKLLEKHENSLSAYHQSQQQQQQQQQQVQQQRRHNGLVTRQQQLRNALARGSSSFGISVNQRRGQQAPPVSQPSRRSSTRPFK